ncbi:stage II sporulation protein R [Brevibacillus ginsengisoli]|uniref:stage II sporulation protein R n=1 Tax=Brevibacillus ginsengisoli TaxID=363854 RepID=UPI003CEB6F1E
MKRFFLILFALVLLVMSWEMQRSEAASATAQDKGPIPQESIRLRIIANSDSFQDQWLKRKVRDAIVDQMNVWVKDLHSYDEAHAYVATKVPELQKVVDHTISQYGFTYKADVDFGEVPFPTKLYGSYVYPAGNYEALRVRIGEAKGQNWWCVLFPPLCFIDMSNGDAVQVKETAKPKEEEAKPTEDVQQSRRTVDNVDNLVKENFQSENSQPEVKQQVAQVDLKSQAPEVEIRFYLWDKLASLF